MKLAVMVVLLGVAVGIPARADTTCEVVQAGNSSPLPPIQITYFNGTFYGYQTTGATSCSVQQSHTATITGGTGNGFSLSLNDTMSASATPGSLHAETSAVINDYPEQYLSYDSNGNPVDNTNPYMGTYDRFSDVLTHDWIKVVDPDPTAMVMLKFTGILDGSVSASTCAFGGESNIAAQYTIQNHSLFLNQQDSKFACAGTFDKGSLGTISVSVGTVLDLTQYLAAEVRMPFGFYNNGQTPSPFIQNASGVADAANTSTLYIDVLTPGASYISGSGVTYGTTPSAVPEPGSLCLLGSGLVGLAEWLRRRLHG